MKSYEDRRKCRINDVCDLIFRSPERVVLWIGAGVSARYGGYPTWSSFLKTIAPTSSAYSQIISDLLSKKKYTLAAELIQMDIGEEEYRTRISNAFISRSNTNKLPDNFISLGIKNIVTTNYDKLLEESLPSCYELITPDAFTVMCFCSDKPKIVKLHGCISAPDKCVLKLSDYAKVYTDAFNAYLSFIFATSTVVFWGVSLAEDEPFRETLRIVQNNDTYRQKHYLINGMPTDEILGEDRRLITLGVNLITDDPERNGYLHYDEILQKIYANAYECDNDSKKSGLDYLEAKLGEYLNKLHKESISVFSHDYLLLIAKLLNMPITLPGRNRPPEKIKNIYEKMQIMFFLYWKKNLNDTAIAELMKKYNIDPIKFWVQMEKALRGFCNNGAKKEICVSLFGVKRFIENAKSAGCFCIDSDVMERINTSWKTGWENWYNQIKKDEKEAKEQGLAKQNEQAKQRDK